MFGSNVRVLRGVYSRTHVRHGAWYVPNNIQSIEGAVIPAFAVSATSVILRVHAFFFESKRPKRTLKEQIQQKLNELRNNPADKVSSAASLDIGASVLLGKGKYVLTGFKLAKLARLASMVVSTGAYAIFFAMQAPPKIVVELTQGSLEKKYMEKILCTHPVPEEGAEEVEEEKEDELGLTDEELDELLKSGPWT